MATPNINNKSQVNNVKLSDFKAGTKKSQMKSSASKSVFDSLDTNKDGVISQNELKGIVKGKVKNKDGKLVEKEYIKLKNLENGRSLVVDSNGKQWVRAKDGTILKDSYVKSGFKKPVNQKAANTPPKPATNSQKIAAANLGKAYKHAEAAFNKQLKDDGWAEDLADGISKLWNNDLFGGGTGNTASQVRKEMQAEKKRVLAMQKAAKQSDSAFRTQFKKIYGVDYNQASVDAYNKNPNEANYKKAFGTKIESIQQRVSRYNQSQKTGGAVVKTGTKVAGGVALGVATGGTGFVALTATALGTTAVSVAVEETDRANITGSYKDASGKTVKQKGAFKEGTDHKKIFKDAAWDGASVLAGGAVGKAAGTIIQGTGKMAVAGRAAMNVTGDVAMGAAQEYAETGQITATGVATNAVMSGVGGAVTSGVLTKGYKAVKKGFGNVADNVSQKFSTKKSNIPDIYYDSNGNILAGGVSGSSSGGGFFSKIKNKISDKFSSETPMEKQVRITNEAKTQRAIDSGLNDAIAQGKVNSDILDRINARGSNASISDSTTGYAISDRLIDALERQKNGNSFVTRLSDNVNLSNISQHIENGGVCSVNGKLYINNNGEAVPIRMSQKTFDRLFDPMKLATMSQDGGTHICVATSQINSMLETPAGRTRLFTMLEDTGDGIKVNLANGKSPIFFPNGKPVKMPGRFMTNAPDGVQMIEQAFMANNIKKSSTAQMTDISTLSADNLGKQSTELMNRRTMDEAARDIGGCGQKSFTTQTGNEFKGFSYKENVREDLEKLLNDFVPGQDVMIGHWGGHARAVVNYDPTTQIVTYRDPMSSGVDTQCTFIQFMHKGSHDYGLRISLQKSSPVSASSMPKEHNASTVSTPQPTTTPEVSVPVRPKEVSVTTNTSNFVSKTTNLTNSPSVVAHTADGAPIRASVTQSNVVIIKNGKYTPIEIPKSGTSEAILETSTDTFLIIKNDNGKVSIVTSETPELMPASNSTTRTTASAQSQPEAKPVTRKRVESYGNTNTSRANTPANTVSSKPKPVSRPPLEIPAGAKLIDTVTIMGKQCRRIQMPNGEFLTEFGGKWKKL